jgi:DNA-directed RNA polymerase subunit E'/Rpb7
MNMVEFQVVFECLICNPVEGQVVECTTKTITKAGIHAEVVTEKRTIPMKIFVARDHNYANRIFGSVKENELIQVRIIGKRFELNDPYIVAIASLIDSKERTQQPKKTIQQKPRITVLEDIALKNVEEDEDEIYEEEQDAEGEIQVPISVPTAVEPV